MIRRMTTGMMSSHFGLKLKLGRGITMVLGNGGGCMVAFVGREPREHLGNGNLENLGKIVIGWRAEG